MQHDRRACSTAIEHAAQTEHDCDEKQEPRPSNQLTTSGGRRLEGHVGRVLWERRCKRSIPTSCNGATNGAAILTARRVPAAPKGAIAAVNSAICAIPNGRAQGGSSA